MVTAYAMNRKEKKERGSKTGILGDRERRAERFCYVMGAIRMPCVTLL